MILAFFGSNEADPGPAWLGFVDGQADYDVGQRELEYLDVKTASRDKRTWATAAALGDPKAPLPPVSITPKGLLDKLSRDEVLDPVAYVAARGDESSCLFSPDGCPHHGAKAVAP